MIGASVKYLVVGAAATSFARGFVDDIQVYLDRYPNLVQAHRLREHAEQIDGESFEFALTALVSGLAPVYDAVAVGRSRTLANRPDPIVTVHFTGRVRLVETQPRPSRTRWPCSLHFGRPSRRTLEVGCEPPLGWVRARSFGGRLPRHKRYVHVRSRRVVRGLWCQVIAHPVRFDCARSSRVAGRSAEDVLRDAGSSHPAVG